MSFLPVVQRELAVTARNPATFRSRMIAAGVAILIGTVAIFVRVAANNPASGKGLFGTLSFLLLVYCLVEGGRATADSLSEEKRSGTLGLLFLTDLRGLDVVLGKLAAASLRTSYALLGVLPVAAVVVPLGGVSGAEFVRTTLALAGVLWVSLTAGLAVSAISRNASRALWGTLLCVGVLCYGPPTLRQCFAWVAADPTWISGMSPITAFQSAEDLVYVLRPGMYWGSLGSAALAGAGLVGLAAWAAPRRWQDRPLAQPVAPVRTTALAARSAAYLDTHPAAWLVMRESCATPLRWLTVLVTVLVGAVGIGVVAASGFHGIAFLPWLMTFALKIAITVRTCHFFARLREDRLIDALAVTPLTNVELLNGFSRGTLLAWKAPLVMVFAVLGIAGLVALVENQGAGPFVGGSLLTVFFTATEAADFLALYWVGGWLAFNSARANAATIRALVWVHVLPAVLCCGLRIVVDGFAWHWAKSRLTQALRVAPLFEPGQRLTPERASPAVAWTPAPPGANPPPQIPPAS